MVMKNKSLVFAGLLSLLLAGYSPLSISGDGCVAIPKRQATILKYESESSEVCVRFLSRIGAPIYINFSVQTGDEDARSYGAVQSQCVETEGKVKFISGGTEERAARACFTEHHNTLKSMPRKRVKPR